MAAPPPHDQGEGGRGGRYLIAPPLTRSRPRSHYQSLPVSHGPLVEVLFVMRIEAFFRVFFFLIGIKSEVSYYRTG